MYKCPECNNEMIWNNDEVIDNTLQNYFSCNDCHIELTKSTYFKIESAADIRK